MRLTVYAQVRGYRHGLDKMAEMLKRPDVDTLGSEPRLYIEQLAVGLIGIYFQKV